MKNFKDKKIKVRARSKAIYILLGANIFLYNIFKVIFII